MKHITVKDALKVIYYVMAIDEKIDQKEMDIFLEAGKSMDRNFSDYQRDLINECLYWYVDSVESENFNSKVHDAVAKIFTDRDAIPSNPALAKPKLVFDINQRQLLWNCMTIAYSDGNCTEEERRLIMFISEKCGLDRSVVLEYENLIQTSSAIEKEIEWLKTTDWKYDKVDSEIKNLKDRQKVLVDYIGTLFR